MQTALRYGLRRSKRQGEKVYVELRYDGTVTLHEGYISQAEARRQEKAKSGQDDGPAASIKPEVSSPLAEYILLHRHGVAQARRPPTHGHGSRACSRYVKTQT